MSELEADEKKEKKTITLKTIIYYNKEGLRYRFPPNSKIACIEEYLKRKMNIRSVQAVYLFDKHRKKLLNSGEIIKDVANKQKISDKLPVGIDCEITLRLSETYGAI